MTSMSVWARSRTALSMAALLALAACGGGGGGSSSSGGGAPSTVSVAGVASKGLLRNAVVTAYAVTNGVKGAALGNTTTDANGRYTLTGLPSGALVLLEVTPKADGSTTMLDEATDVVVTLPGNSDFKLRTAVNLEGSETSAQITPFTHMAVALAESKGGLTLDVVTAANNTVATFVGMPILTAAPSFVQDGGETVASNPAAVTLAAVSELAKSGVGSCTGTGANPTPAAVLTSVSCVTAYLASQGTSSQGVTDSLNTALTAAKADASTTVNTAAILPVAPVTYVATGTQTAIQEAKALISSVRATATALSNQGDATSLASRIKAIEDASYGVAEPLDGGTMSVLTAISEAITAYQDGATAAFPLNVGAGYDNGYGQLASGCKFFTDATFATPAGGRTIHLGCRVLQRVGYAQISQVWQPFAVYHRIGLTEGVNGQFTIKSVLARAPIVAAPATPPAYGTETSLSDAKVLTVNSGAALSVTGDLAPGYEFIYGGSGEDVVALGTHQQVSIAVSETTGATSTLYNLNGDVRVYNNTNIQSRISLAQGSYIEEALVVGPTQPIKVNLILEAQLKSGYKIGGTLVLTNFDQATARPKNGTLTGYLTDMGGTARLFDGSLTLVMPTVTGLDWDATLIGSLVTTGTNTLAINLTAKQSATVAGDFTVAGRYTQGNNTFLVNLVRSDTTPANDRLSLETPNGIGFVVTPADTSVDVKKGATLLGVYDRASSRLVYNDQTYEQF